FAFLSFQHSEDATWIRIMHSLLFQLLYDQRNLRPILFSAYESEFRSLQNSAGYVQQLLTDLLNAIGPTHVVIDGLDEILERQRRDVLQGLISLCDSCPSMKVIVSSRAETDIK